MYRPAFRHVVFCIAASCWQVGAYSAPPLDQAKNLSISQQPLANSLISLGKSNGVSIVFPSQLVRHRVAQPLEGTLSTREALDSLLEQTNLTYREISPRVIAIVPKPDTPLAHNTDNLSFEEMMVIGRSVTGSRLSRYDLEGSSPVDIISAPELARSGTQSLAEFLKFVPAVSGNSTSTAVSNGGDGTATVTLRGLPANNTLVLINGQRIAFDGLAGDAVDLNSIAPAAVERIEILKDGASAIYGSDAIAGVVNIVMKQDFEGFQVEQYYGESSRSDLETVSTNLLFGHKGERGGFMLSASYYSQNGLLSRDRDISANADGRTQGGSDQRASATPDARITLSDDSVVTPDGSGSYRIATDEDLFNYRTQTSSISPSERIGLYTSGYYQLTDTLRATADINYGNTDATITLASVPLYTSFEEIDISVAANNIYNSFGETISDVRRRVLELPARDQINESENTRISLGLDSTHSELHWDANVYWSRSEATQINTNLLSAQKVQRALGDATNCQGLLIDGCVPLNILGSVGSITPAQLGYVSGDTKEEGLSELYGANINLDTTLTELKAGPLLFATGLDLRHESSKHKSLRDEGELFIGGTTVGTTEGKRSVSEAFLELQAPLVNQRYGIHSLDLELALRYSRYSDFGSNSSPKIGVRLRPIRDLLIRSTFSEGFRAPSLNELHKGGYQTQAFLDDPCAQIDNVGVLPGCSQQSDTTRRQHLTEFSGDSDLAPEESTNYTLGIVWTPSSPAGFSISLDHFWIHQTNVVDASPQTILDENALFGSFDDLVQRDNAGNLTKLYAPFINIGEREIKGLDLSLRHQWLVNSRSHLSFMLNTSYLYEFIDQISENSPARDLAGTFTDAATEGSGALPEWKANAAAVWSLDNLELNYSINYISSITEKVPVTDTTRKIKSWTTHDLQLSYSLPFYNGLQMSLGIDNLFDQEPPFAAAAFNDNFDPRTYDSKGRFWYFRATQAF